MRIGIVTFLSASNYGAVLQNYALQTVLNKMGYGQVETIDRLLGGFKSTLRFRCIRKYIFPNYFIRFRNRYLKLSEHINKQRDLYRIQNEYDVIIVGSDQIWNFDIIDKMEYYYYLDWVTNQKVRKISYAASFGRDMFNLSQEIKDKVSTLLNDFLCVSVREKSGISICQEMLGVNADYDLDPTLLLSVVDYNQIVKLERCVRKRYLCSFILDQSKEKMDYVKAIAEKLDLRVINIYPKEVNRWKSLVSSKYHFLPVEKWLQYIYNADFVVTDSFHGMAFSINFNKQFIAINNAYRGSTRFVNLLSLLGLEDRLVADFSLSGMEQCINFDKVNGLLDLERKRSYNRLCDVLKSCKTFNNKDI